MKKGSFDVLITALMVGFATYHAVDGKALAAGFLATMASGMILSMFYLNKEE